MLRLVVTCASVTILAVVLCCAHNAGAQTQMQGNTLGSSGPKPKPPTPKEKRADCTSQGESQGLKGRDLKKFVKECINKAD
jgi:hypothetical protein